MREMLYPKPTMTREMMHEIDGILRRRSTLMSIRNAVVLNCEIMHQEGIVRLCDSRARRADCPQPGVMERSEERID